MANKAALRRINKDLATLLEPPAIDCVVLDRGNLDATDVYEDSSSSSSSSSSSISSSGGRGGFYFWIKLRLRGCPMFFRFPSNYPFAAFQIDPCIEADGSFVPLSTVLAFENYGSQSYMSTTLWSPALTPKHFLAKTLSSEERKWTDIPPYRNHSRINSFSGEDNVFSFPTSCNYNKSSSSGSSVITKRLIATPKIYNETSDAIKCPIVLDNAFTAEEMQLYVTCAEYLKFDNARHESYQNTDIDMSELSYRENDRVVYHANAEEVTFLNDRMLELLPDRIPEEHFPKACGEWERIGLNNIWRFYRYKAEDSEEDANRIGQKFPAHCDNAMVKTTNLLSAMSVLIYLSDDSLFSGGQTFFVETRDLKPFLVNPSRGSALAFWHVGRLVGRDGEWLCPLHQGLPLWNKEKGQQGGVIGSDVDRGCDDVRTSGELSSFAPPLPPFPTQDTLNSSSSLLSSVPTPLNKSCSGGTMEQATGTGPNYKYVLRTDLMFQKRADSQATHAFDLSSPYNGRR